MKRALLERNSSLVGIARGLCIKLHLSLGGAQKDDVKSEDRILADCIEAPIGASYLDKEKLDSALIDRIIGEI